MSNVLPFPKRADTLTVKHTETGEPLILTVLARFSREIGGMNFDFAVTHCEEAGHGLTHLASKKNVIKINGSTDEWETVGELALDEVIHHHGEENVRVALHQAALEALRTKE